MLLTQIIGSEEVSILFSDEINIKYIEFFCCWWWNLKISLNVIEYNQPGHFSDKEVSLRSLGSAEVFLRAQERSPDLNCQCFAICSALTSQWNCILSP